MAKQRTNMAAKPVSMADTKHENQQKLPALAYEFWQPSPTFADSDLFFSCRRLYIEA